MTEVNETSRGEGSERELNPNIDPFLSNLVFVVELIATVEPEVGITIPVTLTTSGAVITGDISSGRTWWPKFEDALQPTGPAQDSPREITELISKALTENVHKVWQSVYVKGTLPEFGQIGYLHLKNARFVLPVLVPPPPADGLLMRVRLEEVQTWSPGRLIES
jgi:hypothetical protein